MANGAAGDRIFLDCSDGLIWLRVEFQHGEVVQRLSIPLTWREALHLGEHLMKSASTVAAGQ
jgi:hypothetical protein